MQLTYNQLLNSVPALEMLVNCPLPAKAAWKVSKYVYIINTVIEELAKKEVAQDANIDIAIEQINVEELGDSMVTPRVLANLSWLFY